ncbi:exodeoxyribonuclease VII large subunit [Microgenomates group bacterium]|nr:exodeoxyribonuclease VII large subunit [Microgenomates group bacterium]
MLKPVFSVSEFNEMVNQHLSLLGEVIVEGEISSIKISNNQVVFITIKDETSSVELFGIVYQLSNLSVLEEGMLVKVHGTPRLYQKSGRFSLSVNQIVPSGEGALKIACEKLRKQLEKEGMFDEAKKRKLPMFPQTIGLITAKGSQAYNDFIKVTGEMTGGLKIFFYPVNVQGDNAVKSVKQAIDYFNLTRQTDVLVITRGGGSLEDLAAFNDESIVRSVHSSKIPTICAIGHEGDISLAELAADLRASTPSNAASLLVRNCQEVIREIKDCVSKIENKIHQTINNKETNISYSINIIEKSIANSLGKIADAQKQLVRNVNIWISRKSENINHLKDKLKALDYKSILKRGFSIVKNKSDQIIKSINQVNLKDQVEILLLDGNLNTRVISKKKGRL